MSAEVKVCDCRDGLRGLADGSVDAIITDPPYELAFMGKRWDATGIAYDVSMWRECLRVLKPGGHLLAFGGTRTYHRMTCAIEDAGFEIRDSLHWIYGSGFPKSLDVSKAIDKAAGAERERIPGPRSGGMAALNKGNAKQGYRDKEYYEDGNMMLSGDPATDEGRKWQGWGTALKPAHEPIVVARKPLVGTVAANVLEYGTGSLNIDGTRVSFASVADKASAFPGGKLTSHGSGSLAGPGAAQDAHRSGFVSAQNEAGRWPPNVLLSHSTDCGEECAEHCAVADMDRQNDASSRFFPCFRYEAKASRKERDAGCQGLPEKSGAEAVNREEGTLGTMSPRAGAGRTAGSVRNHHPTVKPTGLMKWLVKLVTPPNGTVLDPFAGSGTTGIACVCEGFKFIGFEQSAEYAAIAEARIAHARSGQ